jgi:hypothetical protein
MGGTQSASGVWSGPNYMPIGGQYLMEQNDSSTKLSSSFCGTLDGQGHTISNIYCSRRCTTGNYGDGQSVGLIGRLGVHDNEMSIAPQIAAVRNLAVTGYIYANRSVGGIVGKIGKTVSGAVIENCANFATVKNTDAKGCGGIVGAGWNGGVIRNCYNAGAVSSTYTCPTGGISGSNEITIENCYNVGKISAIQDSYAMAIGTNNGGGNSVNNCYWLTGSAAGGGYYGSNQGRVTELTEAEMKAASFVTKLGSAFTADTYGVNDGYPILTWQAEAAQNAQKNDQEAQDTPETQSRFPDVDASAWYADAVNYVADQGLFTGDGNGSFLPEGTMDRAMFVTVMARIAKADISGYTQSSFTDVAAKEWYATAVNWAAANGVVNGVGDGRFDPTQAITLEQMIRVLYNYTDALASADATPPANVGEVSSWARDAMAWANESGLLNGVGGTLSAQGSAQRAQVAQILMNFMER